MKNNYVRYIVYFIICVILVCLGYYLGQNTGKHVKEIVSIPTPVEKEVIDTLYLTRDSLIHKVEYIDSIKYDTIEKVYILSDSATIELFYKLVSE